MTSRLNYVIFSLACISGIGLRTVMMLFTVDSDSGFTKAEYAFPAILLIVFLIAAAGVVFLCSLALKGELWKGDQPLSLSLKPFGVACMVMAAAILFETFLSTLTSGSSVIQQTIHYIFSLTAAVSLIYIGYCKLTGKAYHLILTLTPILFWIMRLIIIFTGFSTISTISDTVIETVGMCLCLISFLLWAKIECNQLGDKYYPVAFATLMLTGYLCCISSIPRMIADIFSVEQAVHLNTVPTFTALASAFFSIACAISLHKSLKK